MWCIGWVFHLPTGQRPCILAYWAQDTVWLLVYSTRSVATEQSWLQPCRIVQQRVYQSTVHNIDEPKRCLPHVWQGTDQTITENTIGEWRGRLAHVCGQKADTSSNYCDNIQPYDKRYFSFVNNMTRFLDCFFKLPQILTSNFRKIVQQHTESMVGNIIRVLLETDSSFQ